MRPGFDDAMAAARAIASDVRNAPTEQHAVAVIMTSVFECVRSECNKCGKETWTGHRTGRRSHAKYCSDRCRVAAMRMRQKSGVAA
jgi:hypothetical protein